MKDSNRDSNGDFEELRRLLLGDELQKLEQIHTHVEIPENFSSQVGEILPQALVKSSEQGDELSEAMVPTVEEIVRLSIKKDINRFADALFPVIGPAIRKAISETLRQMLQSLNRTLEQSLSWQGVKWRIESIRTGIPFAQIALLHSLVYQVEQVFLIHRESGLLLHHLQREGSPSQDPDLVSAMLSAINDFVTDSFAVDGRKILDSVELGDLSIWIEAGPQAIIAVAIRGEAPNSLRTELQQALEQVEEELDGALRAFDGNTETFEVRDELLAGCMQAQFQNNDDRIAARTWIIVAALAGLLLYWGYSTWLDASRLQQTLERFQVTAGYVVTGSAEADDVIVITGLRDPLATGPDEVLAATPLADAAVEFRWQPYQSLEAEFVERRAVRALSPPADVTLALSGTRLQVSGVADLAWRERMRQSATLIAGVETLDDSDLRLYFVPELLAPPPGVAMELDAGVLYVEGAADQAWIDSIAGTAGAYPEVDSVDLRALVNLTEVALERDISELEQQAVFFESSTSYDFDTIDTPKISALVKAIIEQAKQLSLEPQIIVRGYSDSVGSFEDNQFLSMERADFVSQALFNTGISPRYISIKGLEAPVEIENTAAERRYNRRVGFEVNLE